MEKQNADDKNGLREEAYAESERKKRLQSDADGVQITMDFLLKSAKEKDEETKDSPPIPTPLVTAKTITPEKTPEPLGNKNRTFSIFRLYASALPMVIVLVLVFKIIFGKPLNFSFSKPTTTAIPSAQQATISETKEIAHTPSPTLVNTPTATKDLDGKDGFFQAINTHLSDTFDSWSYLVGYYPSDSLIHVKAETDKMGGIDFSRDTDTLDELKKYDQFAKRIALALFKEADSQGKQWNVSVAIGTSDGLSWINYRWKWRDYNGLTLTHNGHLNR